MSLVICPECKKTVSSTAAYCPHCGYHMQNTNGNYFSSVLPLQHSGYDVMLVDYAKSKILTAKRLDEVLECSYLEAASILNNLPCYLYNDLSFNDATYIAQSLQYHGMRIAVFDPYGNASYYAPNNYNEPLPALKEIRRTAMLKTVPEKKYDFVIRRQKVKTEEPKNPTNHMAMPLNRKELDTKNSLFKKKK